MRSVLRIVVAGFCNSEIMWQRGMAEHVNGGALVSPLLGTEKIDLAPCQ